MKYLLKIALFAGLFINYTAQASLDPTFAIKDLLDDSGKVKQTLVFMSERDLQAKVPDALKKLMELPKPQAKDIHPLAMYEFPEAFQDIENVPDSEQKFFPVYPNTYAIIEAVNFHVMPYLLAADVNDYVAVGIYVPESMAGMMYVGYESLDKNLFTEFLRRFPNT